MSKTLAYFQYFAVLPLLIALGLFALLCWSALTAEKASNAKSVAARLHAPWLFAAVMVLIILLARWSSYVFTDFINIDESYLLTNARRFLDDPIPWRGADNTTSGPLMSYMLMWPALFGLELSYATARITAAILMAATFVATFFTLRQLTTSVIARWAILPGLATIAFNKALFQAYVTSILPVTMMALGTLLIAIAARHPGASARRLFALGAGSAAILAAVPLAKLQPAPLAILLCGFAFFFAGPSATMDRAGLFGLITPFRLGIIAGGIATVGITTLTLLATGTFDDAMISYVFGPGYITSDRLGAGGFIRFILGDNGFTTFGTLTLLSIAAMWVFGRHTDARKDNDRWLIFLVVTTLTAIWTMWMGANPWEHYLLFLLHPFILLLGLVSYRMIPTLPLRLPEGRDGQPWRLSAAASMIAVLAALLVYHPARYEKKLVYDATTDDPVFSDGRREIGDAIGALLSEGGKLSVWGYMPEYYLRTGAESASREAMTQFQIMETPYQEYYVERYLGDLSQDLPELIVDATGVGNFDTFWRQPYVAPVLDDPTPYGIPAVAAFMDEHYVLVRAFARCQTPETKIYQRRDLVPQDLPVVTPECLTPTPL